MRWSIVLKTKLFLTYTNIVTCNIINLIKHTIYYLSFNFFFGTTYLFGYVKFEK